MPFAAAAGSGGGKVSFGPGPRLSLRTCWVSSPGRPVHRLWIFARAGGSDGSVLRGDRRCRGQGGPAAGAGRQGVDFSRRSGRNRGRVQHSNRRDYVALEEVIGDFNQRLVGAIVVAPSRQPSSNERCSAAARRCWYPGYSLGDWRELFAYALIGALAGVAATVFVRGLLGFDAWSAIMSGSPPGRGRQWRPDMAAIGLVIAADVRHRLSDAVRGTARPTVVARMAALCVGKVAATVTSYGWGLSGGIFSPTLFMGAMLGGAVAHLVHPISGPMPETVGSFALVGMGAFFAGAIRAPITSILIIFEMTGDYAIILPLMISNIISYTVAARLQPVPIYDALLRQDGVMMPEHQTQRDLRAMTVEQAMRSVPASDRAEAHVVFADQSLDLAMLELGRRSIREAAVVSRDNPSQMIGMLSLEDIAAAISRQ